jgi:hypothetical protein
LLFRKLTGSSCFIHVTPSFIACCKSSCFHFLQISSDSLVVTWVMTSLAILRESLTTEPNCTPFGGPNYTTRYKGRQFYLPQKNSAMHAQGPHRTTLVCYRYSGVLFTQRLCKILSTTQCFITGQNYREK